MSYPSGSHAYKYRQKNNMMVVADTFFSPENMGKMIQLLNTLLVEVDTSTKEINFTQIAAKLGEHQQLRNGSVGWPS